MDKGAKGRTKTVLSLFDEDEDKGEDESNTCAPQDGLEKVSREQDMCKVQVTQRGPFKQVTQQVPFKQVLVLPEVLRKS